MHNKKFIPQITISGQINYTEVLYMSKTIKRQQTNISDNNYWKLESSIKLYQHLHINHMQVEK